MENLGEKLKSLRIDRGWTQSKMGELLSVSQDTVSLWERNKSLPDLGAVVRIVDVEKKTYKKTYKKSYKKSYKLTILRVL